MEQSAKLNTYLLQQRTEFSMLHKRRYLRALSKRIRPFGEVLLRLEARYRSTSKLITLMENELEAYLNYLSYNCANIKKNMAVVDIGCGLGIQSSLIQKYFPSSQHKYFFIDTSGSSDELYYNYHANPAYYNGLEISKQIALEKYQVNDDDLTLIDFMKTNVCEILPNVDFIHSLISCGYHYPVNTYENLFKEKLRSGGDIIIDIRHGVDLGILDSPMFTLINKVSQHKNYDRFHFRKI